MDVASMNLFFALLAGVAAAGSILTIITLLPLSPRTRRVGRDITEVAPWLALMVAATATAGSLYYSEIAGFTPCKLCWFQRIGMYPLVVLLGVALRRGDRGVVAYAVPLCVLGAMVSAYHYQLQLFPDQSSVACSLEAPCSASEVWQFGFVSIPLMAFVGFATIATLLVAAHRIPAVDPYHRPTPPQESAAP